MQHSHTTGIALAGAITLGLTCLISHANAQNLLITGYDHNHNDAGFVDEYTSSGAFVRHFVPLGSGGLSGPYNLKFGPDGNLYVSSDGDPSNATSDGIKEYSGATGAYIRNVFLTGTTGVEDFLFDATGDLYATYAQTVSKIDPATGNVLRSYAVSNNPVGLAFGPNGDLLVTDAIGSTVTELDPATGQTSTFATGIGGIGTARGITAGPDGRYYINEIDTGRIDVVGAMGGLVSVWAFDPGNHYFSVFENGVMYVTTPNRNTVDEFNSSTGMSMGSFGVQSYNSPIGFSPVGIVARPSVSGVPEPGAFAMLTGTACFAGSLLLRRRRK